MPRQQHLLFGTEENAKQNIWIERSLEHHFLFADSAVFGLIHKSERIFA